jgi:fumarate reductase flavoprotein subunit
MGDSQTDAIVAGAGAAGCAAALTLAQAGREVLLIDKVAHHRRASNTAMSTAMIPAGGSRWQAEAGIEDSPATFHADIMRKTRGSADPALAQALTNAAPELVDWLAEQCGVPLQLVTDFSYPGHSAPRCHAVADRAGGTLLRHLLHAVEQDERIMLAVPMRIDDVLVTDRGVSGAALSTPDGNREEVTAESVVLATAGFAANPELVGRHIPEIAGAVHHGGEGSTGDALLIGERLGADTAYLDAYQGHGSLAIPHGILLTWAAVMHGGFLLNAAGERFGDETEGYSEFGARVHAQPGNQAWMVYDERIHRAILPFQDYQDCLTAGAVRWAADVAELASLTGAPLPTVESTVTRARQAADGTIPDPFGRRHWEHSLQAPYGVVKVAGALFHTQGGLQVDGHGRVLRGGAPIPGLYAAGGAAQGVSGHGASGYLAGNGLLAALGLGRLSGQHIAGG